MSSPTTLAPPATKPTLYDREGHLVGAAAYAYATEYAHTGWAEQNPADWWQAVCASTRRLLGETGVHPSDIACITFSGQMMGAVPVDKQARPLRNAIIWADQRALAQERWISERVAFEDVYQITGHRLGASYSLAKILWLRDHQPEIYQANLQILAGERLHRRPADRRFCYRPIRCFKHEPL